MMRIRGSVAIDLGTVNTLIWVTGRGIVLDEPSTIAINSANGAIVAIGSAAESLSEKEPQEISVIHPLRDGVIADLEATAEMLHGFLRKAGAAGARAGLRPERRHLGGTPVGGGGARGAPPVRGGVDR
jgi:rod shape-determining protein MreB